MIEPFGHLPPVLSSQRVMYPPLSRRDRDGSKPYKISPLFLGLAGGDLIGRRARYASMTPLSGAHS
jgi:hypothetical protein